jgi:uncharacterized membrane protein YhaH (DUF805 family)
MRIFSLQGRIDRLTYIGVNAIAFGLAVVGCLLITKPQPSLPELVVAWSLAIVGAGIAVTSGVRRCHDLGWSGWWMLLSLAAPMTLLLALMPGEPKMHNRYGTRVSALSPRPISALG